MALLYHRQRASTLGPTTSTVKRSRLFRGALVNRVGLGTQTAPDSVVTIAEFNTAVYDVGGWFDNSTALLRTRLTVPGGVAFIRFFSTIEFTSGASNPTWINVFLSMLQNDILVSTFGRTMVSPLDGVNIESFVTAPVPCAPGDHFTVSVSGFSDSTIIAGGAISSFGIEAVVG